MIPSILLTGRNERPCALKFILTISNWYRDWRLDNEAAMEADRLGFWGISMADHYLWAEGMDDATMDSWIALAQLASKTKSVHVGTIVSAVPFRPPATLAKMVSTVDVLSNGRTFLGVGAGWSQREFEAFSEWNEPAVRVAKAEEGVRLILALWTQEKVDFQGKFYRSKNGILQPKPLQKPHPPLFFGGFGDRMLRLAGRYGDIVYLPPSEPRFSEARAVAQRAAERSGRVARPSFAAASPVGEGERYPTKYDSRRYRDAVLEAERKGCEYFVFSVPQAALMDSLNDFARNVLPSFS